MKTTISTEQQTITRAEMTWPMAKLARTLRNLVAEHGPDHVAHVLSAGDYYPPLLDAQELQDIEDAVLARYVATERAANPSLDAALAKL